MKKKTTLSKITSILYSFLLLVLGILAIVSKDVFSEYLGIIAGSILIVVGVIMLIYSLLIRTMILGTSFIIIEALFTTLLGIFLCVNTEASITIITYGLGTWLLINGLLKMINSFSLKSFKVKTWFISLIVGAIYFTLSILLFIFIGTAQDIVSIMLGVFLIIAAIANLVELIDTIKREDRETKILNNINNNVDNLDHIDFDFTKDDKN